MSSLEIEDANDTLSAMARPRRRLKVCLASWAPFYAGAEVAAERLAVGLRDAGHDVLVIVGTEGELLQNLRARGVQCRHVPLCLTNKWTFWKHRAAQKKLTSIFREVSPDLVHANDLPTNQMVAQAAHGAGLPRVCHHRYIFDGEAIDWLNKFGAEHHIFVSGSLRREMHAASSTLASASHAVVHDGIPIPELPTPADRVAARQQFQLPLDKVLVAFTGQIIPRKGVADLLRSWSRLPSDSRSRAELVIVGEDLQNAGAHRREMEELSRELNTSARFVGFQKNIQAWQAAMDIAVVPSHVEPLGLVTLEAMVAGLPVIGSRVGGIPECISHEETGWLFTPGEPSELATALQRLIGDENLRRDMGSKGRLRCEQSFSLTSHIGAIVEQYQTVLGAFHGE